MYVYNKGCCPVLVFVCMKSVGYQSQLSANASTWLDWITSALVVPS